MWDFQDKAKDYVEQKKKRSIWKKAAILVAGVVVFCTTYALILPALTKERAVFCGYEEHIHDKSCYVEVELEPEKELVCSFDSPVAHTHDDSCKNAAGTLICTLPEIQQHVHTDSCYEEVVTTEPVVEPEPVSEPTVTHVHSDDCYSDGVLICQQEETQESAGEDTSAPEPVVTTEKVLICTEPTLPVHVHSEACIKTIPGTNEHPHLICGKEAEADHKHEEYCYDNWKLACDKAEHVHQLSCYSDVTADVETEADWVKTFEKEKLNGIWTHDLLLIAESQLGYHESTENYTVKADGKSIDGYTRYGDWYGMPYDEWCAMFASFCLHYAGVNDMPLEAGCAAWITKLSSEKYNLYENAGDYIPSTSDLIFFDWNGDDRSDHVGIVVEVIPATDQEPEKVKTIEGNSSKQVKYNTYELKDERIMGYGKLPVQYGEVYTYSDEKIHVEVQLPEDTKVPADAVLSVVPIDAEHEKYQQYVEQINQTAGMVSGMALYDISFYTADGTYIPVSDNAKVSMVFADSPVDVENQIQVLHFKEDEEVPQVLELVDTGEVVEFFTDGFSTFAVIEVAETAVMNHLDGQSLVLVGMKNQNAPVAITSNPGADASRLQHIAVSWASDDQTEIEATGEAINWTFTAVEGKESVYHIQNEDGSYLNIGNGVATATEENEPQEITVAATVVAGVSYVSLSASVDGTIYYLNQYGGNLNGENYNGFAGWTGGPANDDGSRFALVREVAFKARVIARNDLRLYATRPYAQLVVFVRQIDAAGNAHYYAVKSDGSAVEIYLKSGQLADGAMMYATKDDPEIRWDATGSAEGGWGSAEYEENTQINLQYRNIGTGEWLLPNVVGSELGKITSPHNQAENRPLYWGERPSPVIAVTAPAGVKIDTEIAHMVVANPQQNINGVDRTKRLTYEPKDNTFGVEEILNVNGPKEGKSDQSNVFYFAVIDTSNILEEEGSTDENLVGQILSRDEFQDAAFEYGNQYPFMIIAERDGTYYALDADGKAQPVAFIKDNGLNAGDRVIFQKEGEYNANRILWNPDDTKVDKNAANDDVGWVDLWLTNVATKQYLCPTADGLTASIPIKGDHTPGFYYAGSEIASYIGCAPGTQMDNNQYNNSAYYRLGFDASGNFTVLKGWGGDGTNDQNNRFDDGAEKTKFYVAMLVDRNVTYDSATREIQQYKIVPGVPENAKMYLFNYGSAIDSYGQIYNGTTGYADGVTGNNNLIYRFFHRPSFTGQAIDGTNEANNEYATSDLFQTIALKFGRTLLNGVPYIDLSAANGVKTNTQDADGKYLYSLGYLFSSNESFVPSTKDMKLYQTNGGGRIEIPDELDTVQINNNGDKETAPAGTYNPVVNPNYAVQRFPVVNSGEGTGFFQIDPITGNYYYDSASNAAWYNPDTKKMELYDYAIVPSGSLWCIGGNFLPFNRGHEDGRLVETDAGWQENHQYGINDRTYQLNGFQQDDDQTIGRGSMTDLWMGMYIELEFTMTADGQVVLKDQDGKPVGNPKDMVFDFTGDDDVLIYVDDVLVLDISGIHGAENANINFATGVVDSPKLEGSFAEIFAAAGKSDILDPTTGLLPAWTEHTLKFFYLERGGNISNCRISYNLDYIPTGDLTVSKSVVGIESGERYYGTYEFGLDIQKFGDMSTTAGTEYPIYYEIVDEQGTSISKTEIFKNAAENTEEEIIQELERLRFTLEANQTAKFYGFPENTELRVKEIRATEGEPNQIAAFRLSGSGESRGINQREGDAFVSDLITIKSTEPQNCRITCKNTLDPVKVIIQKELLENDGTLSEDVQEFTFTYVVTTPDGTKSEPQTITVTSGTPVTIGEADTIPFGSKIQVTEVTSDGYQVQWRYETIGSDGETSSGSGSGSQMDEIKLVADITITYTNMKGYELPETGGTGTYTYTLWGILMTAVPLMYGYSLWRKKEKRSA